MKEQLVKFTCDECGINIATGSFPYDKRWIYLYNFNVQKLNTEMPTIDRIEKKDLHFCSVGCLGVHLINLLKK